MDYTYLLCHVMRGLISIATLAFIILWSKKKYKQAFLTAPIFLLAIPLTLIGEPIGFSPNRSRANGEVVDGPYNASLDFVENSIDHSRTDAENVKIVFAHHVPSGETVKAYTVDDLHVGDPVILRFDTKEVLQSGERRDAWQAIKPKEGKAIGRP